MEGSQCQVRHIGAKRTHIFTIVLRRFGRGSFRKIRGRLLVPVVGAADDKKVHHDQQNRPGGYVGPSEEGLL